MGLWDPEKKLMECQTADLENVVGAYYVTNDLFYILIGSVSYTHLTLPTTPYV